MENKELMEALDKVNSAEELAAVFAEHNVELGDMTIEQAYNQLKAEDSGELGEDSLDDVSGGAIGFAVATGIAIAAIAIYEYKKVRSHNSGRKRKK